MVVVVLTICHYYIFNGLAKRPAIKIKIKFFISSKRFFFFISLKILSQELIQISGNTL